MAQERTYLYGIIKASQPRCFPFSGIGGAVYTIPYQEIAAVVSRTDALEFTTLPQAEVLRHLVTYQYVTEQVLQQHSILPAKFGTLVPDEAHIQPILERAYGMITAALAAIEGKIEFDVVAVWNDFGAVLREIGQALGLRATQAGLPQMSRQEAEAARLSAGAAIKQTLDGRRENLRQTIATKLEKVACKLCRHDILENEGMIANLACLLDRSNAAHFDSTLRDLDRMYEQRINFRRVGPLPPHSFYTLRVQPADFQALRKAQELMELPDEVTCGEIDEAYRRLARRFHPDQALGDAQKFQALTETYRMLRDHRNGLGASSRFSFQETQGKEFRVRIDEPLQRQCPAE